MAADSASDSYPAPRLEWVEKMDDASVQAVRDGLRAFNIQQSGIDRGEEQALVARRADGTVMGGILGLRWGGVVEIGYLWVDERYRGQGLGARLLKAFEAEMVARGCHTAILDTFSFQAPEFYPSYGYQLFEVVEGYGDGYQKWYFRKSLVDE